MRSVQTAGSTHAHRVRMSPFKQFVPRLAAEANGWRQPYRQAGNVFHAIHRRSDLQLRFLPCDIHDETLLNLGRCPD